MSPAEYIALAPYITMTVGLIVLLLAIAFARSHLVAAWVSFLVLMATLVSIFVTQDLVSSSPPASSSSASIHPTSVMDLLQLDGYATFYNILFLVIAMYTVLLAYRYLQNRAGELEEFYILILIATLGAMTMAGANHFATFVLGLEILSISLYALVAYPEEKHPPLESAMKYLVLSAVASTTMLFGMALVYNATGTLYFDAHEMISNPRLELYRDTGMAMIFTGLAFKLSLVPFHMWTPDVYQGAPAPITGYIATVSKAAVFALLMRMVISGEALSSPLIINILSIFALLSMIVGNFLALMQENLKRILAYSSIAHMGYLLVALVAIALLQDRQFAVETALVYIAGYALMTAVAFGVISTLSSAQIGDDAQTSQQFRGLFWRRPVLATCLATALLSLVGMPLTIGFIGKMYLFATGIQGTMWILLWALVVGSAISVFYYVKIIYVMTRTDIEDTYPHPVFSIVDTPPVVVLTVSLIVLGAYPAPLIDAIRSLLGNFGS